MDNVTINQKIEKNQNLVHKMINQMLPSIDENFGILSYDDLFQEGMFGLWRAYERFDPSKNVKFSTFACVQIKYAILDCLNNQQFFVKYPYRFEIDKKKEFEGSTLYLNQTVKGSSGEGTTELINALQTDTSLHTYNSESDLEECLDVTESLSALNEKERYAIEQKYFADRTSADIAKDEGVSRQRIDQRLKSGYKKLKTSMQLAYA
ncbi:sigma-70 family RNA polymerase sigma factor [Oceanobacillus oncorhynchi]|uniref:sigma-70 family RNA polymerase sigma factor n=1 Tax=Oceanobacillus oncorhynchi TaxID=545501 RepID=UPI0034D69EA7